MEELLKVHSGDAKRELKKALAANNVVVNAYFGGSIVGNHCMNMAKNGAKIMDTVAAAMNAKLRDATVKKYMETTSVQMKNISTCGSKL